MKKILKKTVALVAMLTLACGIGHTSYMQNYNADAACSKQNIFTETLEESVLEDNNRWVLAKENSTAISIKNVGKSTVCLTPDAAGISSLQYGEKIVLQDKQYVEASFTFENMPAEAVIDFRFAAEKTTDASAALSAEGVSLFADPGWMRGQLNSDRAKNLYGGWGNVGAAGTVLGLQWVNGNAALGAPNASNGKYKMKARFYDDGSAIYYVANPYSDNYFPTAVVGFNNSTFVEEDGFNPLKEGYLQLFIRNAAEAYVGEMEVACYSYEKKGEAGVGIDENGTLIEGSKYTETIEEGVDRKFVPVGGQESIKAATKAILVDNAADDDILVKKTKLSKPNNNYADEIYNLAYKLIIPQLEGTAKAVLYLGGASQSDFSGATKLEFSKSAQGGVQLTLGDKTVATEIAVGDVFDLTIACGGDFVNKIYVNGKAVPVTASENLQFERNLSETFIAYGTAGVDATNKASFGVVSADFKKYNYEQGTGGDFEETFDGGKYNEGNMAFNYNVENMQDFYYADAEDGTLVINSVGYTGVVSSQQSYGDFEFVFEISEFMMNKTETGEELPCNFLISWGRPAAQADYAAGGCGLYLVHGSDLNIMGTAQYAPNYGAWFTHNLPTDEVDENGDPLEKASTVWDYNFSQGNLVFKTVKTGTTVSVYMYTAESAADDPSRTTPICVLIDDYTSAGMVGLCGVPTGKNMSMKVDYFSVKNLDEHKLDNLVVGTEADVVDLDFTLAEDEIIDDPFASEEESSSATDSVADSKEKKGCSGSVAALAGVSAVALAALAFVRRKEDK